MSTSKQLLLSNPITTTQIPLPSLPLIPWHPPVGAMSAPPMDPDCIVLVFDCRVYLYRSNDHCAADWMVIRLTEFERTYGGSAVYCGSKFYYSKFCKDKLYVIDPFLQKAASPLVMRDPYNDTTDDYRVILQEIGGELFVVMMLYGSDDDSKRFRVFKADLSGQEWVRVETLDDHALFHYGDFSICLSAAGVGCKRNSIYACKDVWRDVGHVICEMGSFDLGTGGWTEEDILTHGYFGPWFLPTLDSSNPARASD